MTTKAFGLEKGQSDPVSYKCSCKAGEHGGSVLLFYRYWSNKPELAPEYIANACDVQAIADWQRVLTEKFRLGGKIRLAKEGYNVTVGGTKEDIEEYIDECCNHWAFSGLELDTNEAKRRFFKPSEGCACVFRNVAAIRIAAEITPMGIEGYIPQDWSSVQSLTPEEFHQKCHDEKTLLLDVRNRYESKIGYFIDPHSGNAAILPPIRRFSQWPHYINQHAGSFDDNGKRDVLTYCTGGIRCEKAVRWMQENTTQDPQKRIYTLKGGIAAYLTWMEDEIQAGRKKVEDSLFKGRNYVFDARGSTGFCESTTPVSSCHLCGVFSDQLTKCQSKNCHLILVVCKDCCNDDPRCCDDCTLIDGEILTRGAEGKDSRRMCACEKNRESQLWGGEAVESKKLKRKTLRTKALTSTDALEPGAFSSKGNV
jgi:predicted sulfurtransferase